MRYTFNNSSTQMTPFGEIIFVKRFLCEYWWKEANGRRILWPSPSWALHYKVIRDFHQERLHHDTLKTILSNPICDFYWMVDFCPRCSSNFESVPTYCLCRELRDSSKSLKAHTAAFQFKICRCALAVFPIARICSQPLSCCNSYAPQ